MEVEACVVEEQPKAREKWAGKVEFVLSCVGQCVGIGNVTRFSYLCYKNGGGAFLVPYLITVVFAGVPIYFMELALGQIYSVGGIGVWNLAPAFKGVGYATMVICGWMNIFLVVFIAWALFFMVASFTSVLPWSSCDNWWNTARCFSAYDRSSLPYTCSNSNISFEVPLIQGMNETSLLSNYTEFTCKQIYNGSKFASPVKEYWERYVLEISDGLDQPGELRWSLVLCSLAIWLMSYFSIWRGIKWTGKIVYLTATFPYLLLTVLLIRGLTLPGASEGIKFFLIPDFNRLKESRVWIDAVTQVFFSYGLGLGSMIALGSYSHYKNNVYRDSIMVCLVNSGTSLFGGFVVFAVIGFMAHEQGLPVSEVAASGPGLAYIAYPYAVIQLPVSPLWSVLFFLMLIMLGLDSQFVLMEGFFTAIIDEYPTILRKRRELFIAVVSGIFYLTGFSCLTQGGMYMFQLFDFYASSGICLLIAVFCECVAVSWSYGVSRFYEDLKAMLGFYPPVFWKLTWLVTTPAICLGTLLFYIVRFQPVKYLDYEYPAWAHGIGVMLALSSILTIPGTMLFKFLRTNGTLKERCREIFRPKLAPGTEKEEAAPTEKETFIT